MRTYKSEHTITCDRCGKSKTFNDDNIGEATEWKLLNTDIGSRFSFFGIDKIVDLCPDCYKEFQTAFMNFIPPVFKKALDP